MHGQLHAKIVLPVAGPDLQSGAWPKPGPGFGPQLRPLQKPLGWCHPFSCMSLRHQASRASMKGVLSFKLYLRPRQSS